MPMPTHVFARSRRLLGSSLVLLTCGCSTVAPPQGELMLSIATDMAVPNDIDRVFWSITLEGEMTPFASGTVELTSAGDLPLTLAIEAGPKTKAPVTVRVEGRKGLAPSLLRVSRQAEVVVPKDRVAKLELPLSWLCSGANLSEPCAAGATCQAGHCVAAAVETASLPDFEPSPARDCYDVTKCLKSATLEPVGRIKLKSGREVPCGIMGTSLLGAHADVNLALEVRNENVGSYGFCGPFNECFVPLSRTATADGWHVLDNGDIPAIELPPAVCENSKRSISRVAIVHASPRCPSDLADRPLCPAPEKGCLEDSHICPPTSPRSDWVGYSCSDVNPQDLDAGLLKCWLPVSPEADAATTPDGRWCCLRRRDATDETPTVDDPLLIDDMQGGPQIKLAAPQDQTAGWWHTDIPEGSGDLSPAPEPSLYVYRQFDEPVGPADGPKFHAAACLTSSGFHGWLALQGFYFGGKVGTYGAEARDVRGYAGISFWGWAHEPFPDASLGVSVTFPNVQTSHEVGSECVATDGGKFCDNFFKEVALTAEWKHYVVRWDELAQTQQDWGQVRFEDFKPQIHGIDFTVAGAGPQFASQPFDFCIADVRFEPKAETTP
jgi:hypothetical protein